MSLIYFISSVKNTLVTDRGKYTHNKTPDNSLTSNTAEISSETSSHAPPFALTR